MEEDGGVDGFHGAREAFDDFAVFAGGHEGLVVGFVADAPVFDVVVFFLAVADPVDGFLDAAFDVAVEDAGLGVDDNEGGGAGALAEGHEVVEGAHVGGVFVGDVGEAVGVFEGGGFPVEVVGDGAAGVAEDGEGEVFGEGFDFAVGEFFFVVDPVEEVGAEEAAVDFADGLASDF